MLAPHLHKHTCNGAPTHLRKVVDGRIHTPAQAGRWPCWRTTVSACWHQSLAAQPRPAHPPAYTDAPSQARQAWLSVLRRRTSSSPYTSSQTLTGHTHVCVLLAQHGTLAPWHKPAPAACGVAVVCTMVDELHLGMYTRSYPYRMHADTSARPVSSPVHTHTRELTSMHVHTVCKAGGSTRLVDG